MLKKISLMAVMALALTACGEKTYTVDEFVKDEALTKEYYKKCNKDIDDSEVCRNARKANFILEKEARRKFQESLGKNLKNKEYKGKN